MRIFDAIRGHFALRVGRRYKTLTTESKFEIVRVVPEKPRQSLYKIVVKSINGKTEISVYLSDMLKAYFWLVRNSGTPDPWLTVSRAAKEVADLNNSQPPYLIALMATFDDIEHRCGHRGAIRWIGPKKDGSSHP